MDKIQEYRRNWLQHVNRMLYNQWRTQEFCLGVGVQIQLWTGDKENGDLGSVAP